MKLRNQMILGYSIVLVIVVGMSAAMYRSTHLVADALKWQTHTHEVIDHAHQLMGSLIDMETAVRGYVITGDEAFLEPYKSGNTKIAETLVRLKVQVADDPAQNDRLNHIAGLTKEWRTTIAESMIAARSEANQLMGDQVGNDAGDPLTALAPERAYEALEKAESVVRSGAGKKLMDRLRKRVEAFSDTERVLLDKRSERVRSAEKQAFQIVLGGTAGAAGACVLVLLVITRGVLRRVGGEPRRIAAITDQIARGELDIARQDTTGQPTGILASVLDMVDALRAGRDERAAADFVKTGLARLSDVMLGQQDLTALSNAIVTEVATYVDAQVGALYLARRNPDQDPYLSLAGTYAYTRRKNLSNKYRWGEALVGQAALEKKPIILSPVPDDYIKVTSGLGETLPRVISVTPFIHESEVEGVIEIGTLKPLSDAAAAYLEQAVRAVATSLHAARGRKQLAQALQNSQAMSEELQTQQEELRSANEELEEQTSILKASEQRLQTQHEELEAANEELEEKTELLERQKRDVEQTNAQLEATRQEIEERAEDLALASKYKSEFLANMSHELRTPLNSLLILSNSLAENGDGNLTDDQVESAQVVHSSGNDLLALINDILDLAKIEAGKTDLQLEQVAVADLANGVRMNFRHMVEEKGLELVLETLETAPAAIKSDRRRIEQVLRNLLSNAVKFTNKGRIAVQFAGEERDGEHGITLSVSDTGIGIPKEKQRVIFEAFQQVDGGTARKYGGTGLGLSITRELVKLLGGEIRLQSEVGAGSTFTVYLPAETVQKARAAEEQPESTDETIPLPLHRLPATPAVPDDRDTVGDGDTVILVVEDDPTFAKLMVKRCHDRGLKCLAATSGEEGLMLVDEHTPDAVLLDIKLPGMDGWAVLDQLKERVSTRHVPVHIISGGEPSQDALNRGAIGFLQKPTSSEALSEAFSRIEEMLENQMKKLLIVEDDDGLRNLIVKLIGNGDVQSEATATAGAALEMLKRTKYDCMILDLSLPDMTGFELLKRMEATEEIVLPPVVIYTGRELTREEDEALRRYSDSIIVKGVRSQERLLDEVSLFLHRAVEKMPDRQRKMIIDLHEVESMFEGKRVLIVDDDMRNLFALSKALAAKGIKPIKAEDGKKAVQLLAKNPDVDLILMDIMLPEMDGYEAMRQIRSQGRFERVPIIALTAKAMPQDRAKCIESGASDYMSKPVDINRLLSMMRVWLYR